MREYFILFTEDNQVFLSNFALRQKKERKKANGAKTFFKIENSVINENGEVKDVKKIKFIH